MKKLLVLLALTTIGNVSFSQSVSAKFYPEYGDNPLVQEVPHRDDADIDMSFIDTLLYKVEQRSPLDQPFILDIESRYNEVLGGVYEVNILSYRINKNTGELLIYVRITDNLFYTPGVFIHRKPGEVGGFQTDLYGVEVSYQNGTLLEDIQKVFGVLNKE
jgi:hypothetical protein